MRPLVLRHGRHDAANLISKYGFLALPVTDENHFLKGVISSDELNKTVVSELNQLYAQAVGTDAEEMQKLSPFHAARKKVP
ncbi:MAG TPA: hypothetical protein VLE49_19900 [Anaerolineales bacterium]|nr:hypothetical protein [Anaerolineales bacterium]